ncbi:hypothetical protein [Sphingomicrobium lutaoense]|uniref:Uncharacterized protein n=1 Tax=Sphingomicrobium lutaoense TaxID=515949 RepID=A0A839YVJ3_9SPHN|nr:hypothetical protein [Sphingomicrobium lutaoense]MBB3763056.1 hypothetical protein [Sphingomicrobium lutaoense]
MNELGSGRPEEIFVGIVALVLAVLVGVRVREARRTGEIPLWRKRTTRAEMGETKFNALLLVNLAVLLLLLVAGFDMLLDLRLMG